MKINEGYLALLEKHIDDVIYDKRENTLGDWIADYGAVVNDDMRISFGSHLSLQMMLERRDKEVIRFVLQNKAPFGAFLIAARCHLPAAAPVEVIHRIHPLALAPCLIRCESLAVSSIAHPSRGPSG